MKVLEELVKQNLVFSETFFPSASSLSKPLPAAPFLISKIDDALPNSGLELGALHELALDFDSKTKRLFPPLLLPLNLIRNSINKNFASYNLVNKRIIFIGKNCWPTSFVLEKIFADLIDWQNCCLFLDPSGKDKRLFSTTLALKSPSTLAVLADGSFYKLLDTRRLQLAVKDSLALAFLLRPKEDLKISSAARTRWVIRPKEKALELKLLYGRGVSTPRSWLISTAPTASTFNSDLLKAANG